MNMTVMNVLNVKHKPDNEVFDVHLILDQQEHHFNVDIINNQGIGCLQCEDDLEKILWRNLAEAKKFNRLVFTVYERKPVTFPVEIGDF